MTGITGRCLIQKYFCVIKTPESLITKLVRWKFYYNLFRQRIKTITQTTNLCHFDQSKQSQQSVLPF